MIKGWKLNPEWVRLMDEKKAYRMAHKINQLDIEIREKKNHIERGIKSAQMHGQITWCNNLNKLVRGAVI